MVQLYPTMVPALIHNTQLDQRKVRIQSDIARDVCQQQLS